MVASIINSGYDADKFIRSLSLLLVLRHHSLLVHLATCLPASCMEQEDILPMNRVWKYIYPDLVARGVSLEHQTGDVTNFFAAVGLAG